MKFENYLSVKRNVLILWFAVHGFGLFVNFFGIEGKVNSRGHTSTRIFTTTQRGSSSHFWPFVGIYKSNVSYNPFSNKTEDFSAFKGLFYRYDISEFIAYTMLILGILYFKWDSGQKGTKKASKVGAVQKQEQEINIW